jgi:hypothetical protein
MNPNNEEVQSRMGSSEKSATKSSLPNPSVPSAKKETNSNTQNLFADRASSRRPTSNVQFESGVSMSNKHPRGKVAGPVLYSAHELATSWYVPPHVTYYRNVYGYAVPLQRPEGVLEGYPTYPMRTTGQTFVQAPPNSKYLRPPSPRQPVKFQVAYNSTPTSESEKAPMVLTCVKPSQMQPPPAKKPQLRDYINPEILYLAEQLNLPKDGHKFSPQNWKDALALMYRWKVTDDDVEQQLFERTATNGSSLAYGQCKSVKAFCDKVLHRPSKRRQFSIHWNNSGLKFLAAKFDQDEDYPEPDSPELQTILDNFAREAAKEAAFKEAKEDALVERQDSIHRMWNGFVKSKERLTIDHLKALQDLIEQPVIKTVMEKDGKKVKYQLLIPGFDSQYKLETEKKRGAEESSETEEETKKHRPECHAYDVPTENEWIIIPKDKENTPFVRNRTSI